MHPIHWPRERVGHTYTGSFQKMQRFASFEIAMPLEGQTSNIGEPMPKFSEMTQNAWKLVFLCRTLSCEKLVSKYTTDHMFFAFPTRPPRP